MASEPLKADHWTWPGRPTKSMALEWEFGPLLQAEVTPQNGGLYRLNLSGLTEAEVRRIAEYLRNGGTGA